MSKYVSKDITAMDYNVILAILIIGIDLMWIAMSYYTIEYHDIGISITMVRVVSASLTGVAMILSLAAMNKSAIRFTLLTFFLSLTVFVLSLTSVISDNEYYRTVFGLFIMAVCSASYLKHREWFMFVPSVLVLAEFLLAWAGLSDPVKTTVFTFGISGVILTYYACGLFMFLDLEKNYLLTVSDSITDEGFHVDHDNLYETMSNSLFGVLLFVASIYLMDDNLVHDNCVPMAILSIVMIIVSFVGMSRGYIPEGVTQLIISLYFLCQSVTVFFLDISVLGLLAFVCLISLFVVVAMYVRRKDPVKLISTVLLIAFLAVIALFDYHQAVGGILIVVSAMATYCGVCRMIFSEFDYMLPFYKFL